MEASLEEVETRAGAAAAAAGIAGLSSLETGSRTGLTRDDRGGCDRFRGAFGGFHERNLRFNLRVVVLIVVKFPQLRVTPQANNPPQYSPPLPRPHSRPDSSPPLQTH